METARSFDASRALSEATQFNMAKETRSKACADMIVKKLEAEIKQEAAEGGTACRWLIPEDESDDFDLEITAKAIRHYLRSGGFYWTQNESIINEYVVRWEATNWIDYLRPNNWDSRYCWLPNTNSY